MKIKNILTEPLICITTLVNVIMCQYWDIRQIFCQNLGTVSPALDFGTSYTVVKILFQIISSIGVCRVSGIVLGYLIFMTSLFIILILIVI